MFVLLVCFRLRVFVLLVCLWLWGLQADLVYSVDYYLLFWRGVNSVVHFLLCFICDFGL